MKLKDNSSKKTKLAITKSPLLRFKQRKRSKTKNDSLLLQSGMDNHVPETVKILKTLSNNKGKSSKIVLDNISRNTGIDKATKASVVQMPSKCKSNFDNLNFSFLHEFEKDDADKFTSLKCLMSTGYEVSPSAIDDTFGQHNSELKSVNNVKSNNEELHSTKFNKQQTNLTNSDFTDKTPKNCSITVCMSDKETSSANIYELPSSKCLVILKPEHYFYVIGIVELELLQGSVEVLGYKLNKQREKKLIFSPLWSSHMFIKSTAYKNNFECKRMFKLEDLLLFGLPKKLSRQVLRECDNCSVFILSRSKAHVSSSVWPYFFERYFPLSIFPTSLMTSPDQQARSCHVMECRLGCILEGNIQELGSGYNELPEWSKVVKEMTTSDDLPKVILCGGKSAGKSTLLRYLINKCLKKWQKVLVLDFDPGQCEFTVAGCISVTLVEEPVLGPNFSHLKEPLRSVFLGEVDVTKCPEDYIEGCKSLINYAENEHDSIPWLINTMGFAKGFGVTLTCGIIQNVGPTSVIQIHLKNPKQNFPSLLESGFVYSQDVGSFRPADDFKIYNLHILQSASKKPSQKQRSISPKEARHLVLLSYLSNMLDSKITSLSQVTPYMMNMKLLNLKTTNKCNLTDAQIAATMNGNLVALCSQSEVDVVPNCHGFGIVRGIDWQAGDIFLITPLNNQTLVKINCLIKGNVALPDSLYYNQGPHVKGHIPYIAHTSGGSTALFAKRDYRVYPTTSRGQQKTVR